MTSKEQVLATIYHIQSDANVDNFIAMIEEVKGATL